MGCPARFSELQGDILKLKPCSPYYKIAWPSDSRRSKCAISAWGATLVARVLGIYPLRRYHHCIYHTFCCAQYQNESHERQGSYAFPPYLTFLCCMCTSTGMQLLSWSEMDVVTSKHEAAQKCATQHREEIADVHRHYRQHAAEALAYNNFQVSSSRTGRTDSRYPTPAMTVSSIALGTSVLILHGLLLPFLLPAPILFSSSLGPSSSCFLPETRIGRRINSTFRHLCSWMDL